MIRWTYQNKRSDLVADQIDQFGHLGDAIAGDPIIREQNQTALLDRTPSFFWGIAGKSIDRGIETVDRFFSSFRPPTHTRYPRIQNSVEGGK